MSLNAPSQYEVFIRPQTACRMKIKPFWQLSMEKKTQKQRFPSFATAISALGIILYCIGFLRVEIELNNQKERLFALENVAERTKPPSSDQRIVKIIKDVRGMHFNF